MNDPKIDLAIAVGMPRIEQVASQLPFDSPAQAEVLTCRLVSRRSLPSVNVGRGY